MADEHQQRNLQAALRRTELDPLEIDAGTDERGTCRRCRRPTGFCYCALLPQLPTRTHVVILQHLRERHVAIGTARMAHLALPNSVLIEGIQFDEHHDVDRVLAESNTVLLFPGEGAQPAEAWAASPPVNLIVVDGTWWQAKKLLQENPRLAALPRMGLSPTTPGNYRIRKEPTDQHLATVEAVAATLGVLEGEPERFAQMLVPFNFMVDRQLQQQSERGFARRRRKRTRAHLVELEVLRTQPERAVLIYAEANAHSRVNRAPGAPELLHLVAVRPATGARFEAIVRPRRPLGDQIPERLRISAERFAVAEAVSSVLDRWRDFSRSDDKLCAWGPFARDLLALEEGTKRGFTDLRSLAARVLQQPAGGIIRATAALASKHPGSVLEASPADAPPMDDVTEVQVVDPTPRALSMLGLLEGLYQSLLDLALVEEAAAGSGGANDLLSEETSTRAGHPARE